MQFQRFAPPEPLKPYIQYFWVLAAEAPLTWTG